MNSHFRTSLRLRALALRLPKSPERGFTLIELMIVVGIIGILVAIAIPNFSRYQSKARQSEAKIALAAVYTSEKSFYAEYSAYLGSFDAVGYSPEGYRRYYGVGFSSLPSGTVTGYAGVTTNNTWAAVNNSFVCGQTAYALGTPTPVDAQTFDVSASGCIRQANAKMDVWNIDESKTLQNNNIAL